MSRDARPFPVLEGERVVLRLGASKDAFAIADYYRRNRRHLEAWEPKRAKEFFTKEFWSRRVRKSRREFRNDESLRLFVFKRDEPQRVIGSVNFTNFARGAFLACTLGYSLDAREQGFGYMTEALRRAIPYVLEVLGFHRIMANYVPRNRRSARLLKRLRFRIEGRARSYLKINGRWEDHVLTSLVER